MEREMGERQGKYRGGGRVKDGEGVKGEQNGGGMGEVGQRGGSEQIREMGRLGEWT